MARKPLTKKTRFEVFKRDQFVCQYCGSHPPSVVLHVDHIHPVAEGGTNDIDNLVTACQACNLGKGATLLSNAPAGIKEKAELVAEREAQIRGYNEVLKARAQRIDDEAWEVAAGLEGEFSITSYSQPKMNSIKKFLEKLPQAELLDAVDSANAKCGIGNDRAFKYFCGICWGKIRDAQNG